METLKKQTNIGGDVKEQTNIGGDVKETEKYSWRTLKKQTKCSWRRESNRQIFEETLKKQDK